MKAGRARGEAMAVMAELRGFGSVGNEAVDEIGDDDDGGTDADDLAETLFDEMADRLAIAAQQPGEKQEAGAAGDDRRDDEEAEIDVDDARQDRYHLDRRQ